MTQLASCAQFAAGYSFGSVRLATVQVAGETATQIPIQLIGVSKYPNAPASCSSSGHSYNTVTQLRGASGILGIGVKAVDCGTACATLLSAGWYYNCADVTNCTVATVPIAQQIANPVAHFPTDNNGVIVQMPSISTDGAASATGTLVFGIGTQSNNHLDSNMQKIGTDAACDFSVTYNNTQYKAVTDTGTSTLAFPDSTLTQCGLFYCPASLLTKSAAVTGSDGATTSVTFLVGNATTLLNTGLLAFNDLAGSAAVPGVRGAMEQGSQLSPANTPDVEFGGNDPSRPPYVPSC